jgi:GntR family transcriptional regulator of gluconate operon
VEPRLTRDPLGDQIVRELRRDVIVGRLVDGAHLPEETLAERFGVSRGPVRDALRTLAAEGLVTSVRGRIYVRALGPQDVRELYSLRRSLEALALRDAVANPGLLTALQASVAEMATSAAGSDEARMADADLEFHSVLYRLAGNSRLLDTWERYAPTFGVLLRLSNTPDLDSAVEDHEQIIDVIRSRPIDDAVTELAAHISRGEAIVHRCVVELGARASEDSTATPSAAPFAESIRP